MEFFNSKNGRNFVSKLKNKITFADLKLHDIPNTCISAIKAIKDLRVNYLTMHISSGLEALKAAKKISGKIKLVGVTILTSLDNRSLKAIGFNSNVKKIVLHQARLANKAKLDAIVCSAQEVKTVKKVFKKEIITPGIRFGSKKNDQKRVLTPKQAFKKGSDWLVIGRPITKGNIKKFAYINRSFESMILKTKICGVSDSKTLRYIINHSNPAQFIGFIVNYPKSKRFVDLKKLKELLKIKKKSLYVAVLVNPNHNILEEIKNFPFDYYQLYDCSPSQVKSIKKKYEKKIITAITVKNEEDVVKYKLYSNITDIYLFDSKGYEKSMSFNHKLINDLNLDKEIMIAGNIQVNDNLENFKKIADIIDISGGLETAGLKDISKIEIFLNRIKNLNYET